MYGFLIKKNFCDGWDNMLSIMIPNFISLLIATATIYATHLVVSAATAFSTPLMWITIILGFSLATVPVAAFTDNAERISNFGPPGFKDFFVNLGSHFTEGFLFGMIQSVIVVLGIIGIPFYFSMGIDGNFIGYVFAAIMFWFEVIVLLSLQWFFPIRALMHNDFKKSLKKCFIIFFDNVGFSVFMAIYDLLLAIFSIPFITIMPSGSGILLAKTNALRLRLYKYDWLEQHPDLRAANTRKNIPWDQLIREDEDALGHRSFKSFFMPWKDN